MSDKIVKGLLVAGGFAAGFATSKYLDSRAEAVEEPEDFDDDFFNESEVDVKDEEPAKEETTEE